MIPHRFASLAAAAPIDPVSRDLAEQGYAVLRGAIAPALVDGINRELDERMARTPFSVGAFHGNRTKRFHGLLKRSRGAHALILHDGILAAVRTILGQWCDFAQLNLSQALEIHPGAPAQIAHRDQTMWPAPRGEIEYSLNVLWPLGRFTAENGATRMWPGSHHDHLQQEGDLGPAETCLMEPGDALLFLGSTLHAAGANHSATPRRAIIISYSLGWLKSYENQSLTYSPEFARTLDPALAAMIGYRWHRPNLGTYDGQCPSILLQDEVPEYLATFDSLTPAQTDIVDAHARRELERMAIRNNDTV
ncbi:MAG: Phytanoyl-CoA dioxygenase [Sphingomonas bacterium]|nr:phytanoyl-CoA dioxygenase family protein [Sphingomonas bacterium]MDB5690437.1 Phytanoyl-CoA dioxygenase [Sphingomonas bacterium]